MDVSKAARFYNACGVSPQIDPFDDASRFAVERIEEHLKRSVSPGDRVLDLGCGAGRFTFALERLGAVATGIDCAETLIAHAQEAARERKSRCSFVVGDYVRLGEHFEAGSFDACLLALNLGEIPYSDMDKIARQLRRVLVPGGSLLIEMLDDAERYLCGEKAAHNYEPSTGRMETRCMVPDHGVFELDYYFWTVAFAKEIIGRHLRVSEGLRIEDRRYWLVFANQDPAAQ